MGLQEAITRRERIARAERIEDTAMGTNGGKDVSAFISKLRSR